MRDYNIMTEREINLLPPMRRRVLRREHILALFSKFLLTLVIGSVMMSAAAGAAVGWLALASRSAATTTQAEFKNTLEKYQTLKKNITVQNDSLKSLVDLNKRRFVWSDFLHALIKATPQGIVISHLSGAYDAAGTAARPTLTVRGEAANRNLLLTFQNALQKISQIDTVNSPVSNLLERFNSQFQFDVQLKPPKV